MQRLGYSNDLDALRLERLFKLWHSLLTLRFVTSRRSHSPYWGLPLLLPHYCNTELSIERRPGLEPCQDTPTLRHARTRPYISTILPLMLRYHAASSAQNARHRIKIQYPWAFAKASARERVVRVSQTTRTHEVENTCGRFLLGHPPQVLRQLRQTAVA
jgi:hypothetical protein